MNWRFKLSMRLSLLKNVTAAGTIVLAACSTEHARYSAGPDGDSTAAFANYGSRSKVNSVTISPSTATIARGSAITLVATARDVYGREMRREMAWSSSSIEVATVAAGIVQSRLTGTVTISATTGGRTGHATITIIEVGTPPPPPAPVSVASVSVAPGGATGYPGDTVRLSATTRDSAGNLLTGRALTWTSSSSSVAIVSSNGLVTALTAGSAIIAAASGSVSGTASLTVTASPVTPPPPPAAGPGEPTFDAASDQLIMQDNFDAFATIDARHAELLRLRSTQGASTHAPFVSDNRMTDVVNADYQSRHLIVTGRGGTGRALRSVYFNSSYNQSSTWITWPAARKYAVDTSVVVYELWFRVASPGWQVDYPGMKWFEWWHPGATSRTQISLEGGNERFHVNPASQGNFAYQPAGTRSWAQVSDGTWHRMLIMYRPATVQGDQRGIVRMWIDGQKVIDMSAQGVLEGYCTAADVSRITALRADFLKWPDVLNTNSGGTAILEFDDLRWWIERTP